MAAVAGWEGCVVLTPVLSGSRQHGNKLHKIQKGEEGVMKKNLRTAGITATIEMKDGSLISLDRTIPQSKAKAARYIRRIRKRGLWRNVSDRMFDTERYICPEDIANILTTYEPITVPARPERPVPNAS